MTAGNSLLTSTVFALLLSACGQKDEVATTADGDPNSVSSAVLATVNGEPITESEVDLLVEKMFKGANRKRAATVDVRNNVLESLIASRAMSQQIRSQLSDEKMSDIGLRVKSFEEELLVKEYLTKHAPPKPITSVAIRDYYDRNPEEFGGGERRLFEMLSTTGRPSEQRRNEIINAVPALKKNSNWQEFGADNQIGLRYQKATMQPNLFAPALEAAVKSLDASETSDSVFIDGVPHLVRVLEINDIPARPLAEVRTEIHKKLAALQLKRLIKQASEQAVSQANVVRN